MVVLLVNVYQVTMATGSYVTMKMNAKVKTTIVLILRRVVTLKEDLNVNAKMVTRVTE